MLWDIFCRVIDNFGDIGVCWRLSSQLAAHHQQVRLWVDDATALQWMAPHGQAGVQVLPWAASADAATLAPLPRADVWVEAFGCEITPAFIAHYLYPTRADADFCSKDPVWINLEYLSAEAYVRRCHGLPSPQQHGPGRGHTKYFFYPGFGAGTGGLLREHDLLARQAAFRAQQPRAQWLTQVLGAAPPAVSADERWISLFCYEPAPLAVWLQALAHQPRPTRLLVCAGRPALAVRAAWPATPAPGPNWTHRSLSVHFLPWLTQAQYDALLWCCDLNAVRGEDSAVRALWAGRALLWQLYPQHDGAHTPKLQAWLDVLDAPAPMRAWHALWNGTDPDPSLPPLELQSWDAAVTGLRKRLADDADLCTALLRFVHEKR